MTTARRQVMICTESSTEHGIHTVSFRSDDMRLCRFGFDEMVLTGFYADDQVIPIERLKALPAGKPRPDFDTEQAFATSLENEVDAHSKPNLAPMPAIFRPSSSVPPSASCCISANKLCCTRARYV